MVYVYEPVWCILTAVFLLVEVLWLVLDGAYFCYLAHFFGGSFHEQNRTYVLSCQVWTIQLVSILAIVQMWGPHMWHGDNWPWDPERTWLWCILLLVHNHRLIDSQGFIWRMGGGDSSPLQEILNLSMVIIVVPSILILHVTGHKYVSSKCFLESLSQIASEAIWEDLNSKFS